MLQAPPSFLLCAALRRLPPLFQQRGPCLHCQIALIPAANLTMPRAEKQAEVCSCKA